MSHRMNTMPTARRGRVYYKEGANDNRGLGGVCSVVAVIMLLMVPPVVLYGSERSRHTRYIALSDALDGEIVELNHRGTSSKKLRSLSPGILVHGVSDRIDTISSDRDMGVAIPGALALRRRTEYCQWQEIQSQSCQTCKRTVRAKDGSTKEEKYQCNCIKEYNYVKAWRSRRINSLLFDQPGAHHNPQRDPMPSRTFVSEGAKLAFDEGVGDDTTQQQKMGSHLEAILHPGMLASGVRNQPYRRVDFTPYGAPPTSFFDRIFAFFGFARSTRTRYESLQMLRDTPNSPAAIHDNFVYVGQGGYFFSPMESSTSSKLFNWFAQYLEGSLFDWQIGDLMPSCTAGDVRFSYEVVDPTVVSVLGQIGHGQVSNALQIAPRTMHGIGDKQAAAIGLVHSGAHSAQEMLVAEDSDSKNKAHLVRALLFVWSIPASRLVGVALGRELGESSLAVQVEGVTSIFFTLLGAMWLAIWGESYGNLETTLIFFLGAALGYLAYRSSVRKGAGRWRHAVWCRVAKWANAPPEWRVKDSYIVRPEKAVGGGSGFRPKMD